MQKLDLISDIQDKIWLQLKVGSDELDSKLKDIQNLIIFKNKQRQDDGLELYYKQNEMKNVSIRINDVQKKMASVKLREQHNFEKLKRLEANFRNRGQVFETAQNEMNMERLELKDKTMEINLLKTALNKLDTGISGGKESQSKAKKDISILASDKILQDFYVNQLLETRDESELEVQSHHKELDRISNSFIQTKRILSSAHQEMSLIAIEIDQIYRNWSSDVQRMDLKRSTLKIGAENLSKHVSSKLLIQTEKSQFFKFRAETQSELQKFELIARKIIREESVLTAKISKVDQFIEQFEFRIFDLNSKIKDSFEIFNAKDSRSKSSSLGVEEYKKRIAIADSQLRTMALSLSNTLENNRFFENEQKQAAKQFNDIHSTTRILKEKLLLLTATLKLTKVKNSDLVLHAFSLKERYSLLKKALESLELDIQSMTSLISGSTQKIEKNLLAIEKWNKKLCKILELEDDSSVNIFKSINMTICDQLELFKHYQNDLIWKESNLMSQITQIPNLQVHFDERQEVVDTQSVKMKQSLFHLENLKNEIILKSKNYSILQKQLNILNSNNCVSDERYSTYIRKLKQVAFQIQEFIFKKDNEIIERRSYISTIKNRKDVIFNSMIDVDENIVFWKMEIESLQHRKKMIFSLAREESCHLESQIRNLELDYQKLKKEKICYLQKIQGLIEKRNVKKGSNNKQNYIVSIKEIKREVTKYELSQKVANSELAILRQRRTVLFDNIEAMKLNQSLIESFLFEKKNEIMRKENEKYQIFKLVLELQFISKEYQLIKSNKYRWTTKDAAKRMVLIDKERLK
eukprot:NODE_24_length_41419_cov_0.818780.p1 type:complete len:807 gc:universal NODE_24_length_41419_cov_0.818780:20269-17849(-)